MPLNILLAFAVMNLSVFYTEALFMCFPGGKEITKQVGSDVQTYCKLGKALQPDEQLTLQKDETVIGLCLMFACKTTRPYLTTSLKFSTEEQNVLLFQISNLTPDNSGTYYAVLKNDSTDLLINQVLVLNLTVNQPIATCSMNLRISSWEIELSCAAMFHSYGKTTLQLIVMDNGTEVNVNSSACYTLNSSRSYVVGNLIKFFITLNAFWTKAVVPKKCILMTFQKSHTCEYPSFLELESPLAMLAQEFYIGCGFTAMEVWLITNHFKILKAHSSYSTIVDANVTDGNSFIVICGVETQGQMNIRSIIRFKMVTRNENDTCFTARVKERWTQTTLDISPGCVSNIKFDRPSYRPSSTPKPSLTTDMTVVTDKEHPLTEITTNAHSNNTIHLSPNGATVKTDGEDIKSNRYLIYAKLSCIVASVTILFTVATCLFLAHQRMNVNAAGKSLRLQYYRYDRQEEDLASERRDNQARTSTAMTSNLINSRRGSQQHLGQIQNANDGDGYSGEVPGTLAHRPALPPRGHSGASSHETDSHKRHSVEHGKADAFAVVTSKRHQAECYPPTGLENEKKPSCATEVPQDSESIYHTVNDSRQDVNQSASTINSCLPPGAFAKISKGKNEISAVVQPVERAERVDNDSHNVEGKVNEASPDQDISVEELYAKPNKKGKANSLFTTGCSESLDCNVTTPLESPDYAELRQSLSERNHERYLEKKL